MTPTATVFGHPHSRERVSGMRPIFEYDHASDDELLAAARNSDGCAFAELCRRHALSIRRKVFRILRNAEDTEDVLQESMCKAYIHLCCFRGACAFSVWLTRIAMNTTLMMMRKRKLRRELSCDRHIDEVEGWGTWEFPDPSPNAEMKYVKQEAIKSLKLAIKQLPPRYRSIFEQFHGTDQSLQEAANKVGIKVCTAKSRLMRARHRIRTSLIKRRLTIDDFRH